MIDYIRTKYISVYNRRDRYFEKRINKLDNYDVEPVRDGIGLTIPQFAVNANVYTVCKSGFLSFYVFKITFGKSYVFKITLSFYVFKIILYRFMFLK